MNYLTNPFLLSPPPSRPFAALGLAQSQALHQGIGALAAGLHEVRHLGDIFKRLAQPTEVGR